MISTSQLLPILVAGFLGFIVGAPWYSKYLFGGIWLKQSGFTEEQCKEMGHNKLIYVYAFLLSLVSAFVFAFFLGPQPSFFRAIGLSLIISVAFIATTSGINDLFSNRSWRLFLIDAGYHIVRFLIYAIVLGLWY